MNRDLFQSAARFAPTTQSELQQFLASNFGGAKSCVVPVGGGTSLPSLEGMSSGNEPARAVALVLTAGLDRVVDFAARDMTVTVEAGISVKRLTEVLRSENQRFPIDVPQAERATLGGAIAADASGPRRFGLGTFRDSVIGLTAITVDGRTFHSGGRVVKNVAGYDLCKLLIGSEGTLAIVTQVTLKLKPIPESSALACVSFENIADRDVAVAAALMSQTRPVAIDTLNPAAAAVVMQQAGLELPADAPLMVIGFEGSQREVDWQVATIEQEQRTLRPQAIGVIHAANECERLWAALTEFPACGQPDEGLTIEAHVPSSKVAGFEEIATRQGAHILARAADGVIYAKWVAVPAAGGLLTHLRAFVRACGGSLRVAAPSHSLQIASADEAAAHLPRSGHRLMRELKVAFDGENLLRSRHVFT